MNIRLKKANQNQELRWGLKNKALMVMVIGALASFQVSAQSLGTVADTVVDSGTFNNLFDLLWAFCRYILGPVFTVKAFLQLKEHSNNPEHNKLSKALTSAMVGACFFAIDNFSRMFSETLGVGSQFGVLMGLIRGGGSGGDGNLTLGGAFVAMSRSLPALMHFISLGAVLSGFFFMVKAVLMLPQLNEGRVPGHKVIWTLVSGVGLYSLSPLISTIMGTLGMGTPNPGSLLVSKYGSASSAGDINSTIAAVLMFIQLLGLIGFIRGMLILKAMGDDKDGTMGRALTFLGGGAAAMNISWTVGVLANSIGAHGAICGIASALCSI